MTAFQDAAFHLSSMKPGVFATEKMARLSRAIFLFRIFYVS
jgi:hypothetical protein